MNKIQKMVMSFAAVALIVGGSAFTNVIKVAPGDEFGSNPDGSYRKLTQPYNPMLCEQAIPVSCGYRVTEAGGTHVTADFTASQAEDYLQNGWISEINSSDGNYTGL